jgi:ABC-type transport system substrate-binding protein
MPEISQKNFFLNSKKIGKWPSRDQWKQFLKILDKRERVIFFTLLTLAISSFLFISVKLYFDNTEIVPSLGGVYVEGIVGQPELINPIYASPNDADRDLVQLIFSGLMEYDSEGNLYPALAQNYPEIKENGKVFEVSLRDNLSWDDGSPLTADDVIFTIKTIQNDSYKSPLRPVWLGVEVEKISDKIIRFTIENPSASFIENLTLKIIPKHIWQDKTFNDFKLAPYNLLVGSGPFKFKEIKQASRKDGGMFIEFIALTRNPNYFSDTPKIQEIKFYFFNTEESLNAELKSKKIKGFSISSISSLKNYSSLRNNRFSEEHISQPRYFAVFFNPEKSKALVEINVRKALNYGTNKKEIIDKIFSGQGKTVDSPILPEILGFSSPSLTYEFDMEKAKKLLDDAGFTITPEGKREKTVRKEADFSFKSELKTGSQGKEVEELQKCLAKDPDIYPEGEITGFFGNSTKKAVIKFQEKYAKEILEPSGLKEGTGMVGSATRKKLNELCAKPIEEILTLDFSLMTVDQPLMIEMANVLKEQWKILGVDIQIKKFDIATLESDIIKKRGYDMLLFGEVLSFIPDPLPFWHSSLIKDPGLNLALYENKDVDKILEEARQILDSSVRAQKYEEFQNILIADAPVVFLCNPDYIYFLSNEIKGVNIKKIVDPSKRFAGIENWYIFTKRVLK